MTEKPEKKKRVIISEGTGVTVGVLALVIGAVLWLSAVYNTGQANAEAIVEIKGERKEYLETVKSIDTRISFIEGYMRARNKRKGD